MEVPNCGCHDEPMVLTVTTVDAPGGWRCAIDTPFTTDPKVDRAILDSFAL